MIDFKNLSSKNFGGGVVPLPKTIREKLNEEQIQAIHNVKKWLKTSDKYYSLVGKGGTGKTTIISEALKDEKEIIGIAISHKATERLSESIKECYTLAKALGMKMSYSESGELVFKVDKFARNKPIKTAKIIVIDECSMITDSNMIEIEKMTPYAKIIYMGDFRQLPPIEEGRVPDANSKSFNFPKNRSSLTERVRQGVGNPIIELSDVLAKEIEDKTNNPYAIMNHLHDNLNKDKKGYTYLDSEYISDFVFDFKKDSSTRFICFRNYKIKNQNKRIRNMIHNNPKEEYIVGELLIAKESYYSGDELVMKNSQEFFIEKINESKKRNIDCLRISSESLKGDIYVVSKKGRADYKEKLKQLLESAKKDPKLWKNYFSFKDAFSQVDYGYAINTHKSQGSTYKNVYLDFNDILNVSKTTNKEKCQSLYVGITRASHNLYLVDL